MRLAHTALFAADLERARTFYTRYFDCTAGALYHNPRTGFRSYFLTFPEGGQLELMAWDEVTPRPEGRFRGLDHIACHPRGQPPGGGRADGAAGAGRLSGGQSAPRHRRRLL